MRGWLKNTLVTLYERDEDNNLLTKKQKLCVNMRMRSTWRLETTPCCCCWPGTSKRNYNINIFPVHWQFSQLDQYPINRYLSYTELAALRAPLIPMEHYTTCFFEIWMSGLAPLVSRSRISICDLQYLLTQYWYYWWGNLHVSTGC